MAAGITQLTYLNDHPEVYTKIETNTTWLANQLRALEDKHHAGTTVNQIGSLLSVFFTEQPGDQFCGRKVQ